MYIIHVYFGRVELQNKMLNDSKNRLLVVLRMFLCWSSEARHL